MLATLVAPDDTILYVARTCDGEIQTWDFISVELEIRVHRGVPVSGASFVELAIDCPGKMQNLVDERNDSIPLGWEKRMWSEHHSLIVSRKLLGYVSAKDMLTHLWKCEYSVSPPKRCVAREFASG